MASSTKASKVFQKLPWGALIGQQVWYSINYELKAGRSVSIKIMRNEVIKIDAFFARSNPLNAELNPTCHLLILLGDLTFMDTCIVSIFQYIFNKMQRYTVYSYFETALHVSCGTSTHHQERVQLYLQHLVFVTPLLLSAAIVER